MVVGGTGGDLGEEEVDREEIIRTLLSKEEKRKLERAELIRKLEAEEPDEKDEITIQGNRIQGHRKCPYLDTIKRKTLDFDFEKLCR